MPRNTGMAPEGLEPSRPRRAFGSRPKTSTYSATGPFFPFRSARENLALLVNSDTLPLRIYIPSPTRSKPFSKYTPSVAVLSHEARGLLANGSFGVLYGLGHN